jgi:hypothetical protein
LAFCGDRIGAAYRFQVLVFDLGSATGVSVSVNQERLRDGVMCDFSGDSVTSLTLTVRRRKRVLAYLLFCRFEAIKPLLDLTMGLVRQVLLVRLLLRAQCLPL